MAEQVKATASKVQIGSMGKSDDGQQIQLVTFLVGQEEFGVDILTVQEINRMLAITRVPEAPPEVEGLINLRGRTLPVVNLRRKFSMPEAENQADSRIVVVNVGKRTLGFIVDSVNEVLRINSSIVEPAPPMATGQHADYICGIGKLEERLLILLDLEKLFGNENYDVSAQAAGNAA